jgi:hypothetical protein
MPDAQCTRGLVCNCGDRTHTSNNEYTGITRHSRTQWFYGLLATIARGSHRKLDASVGASGPHVFAVRLSALRPRALPRPPHPVPALVTLRNAPLLWDRMAILIA